MNSASGANRKQTNNNAIKTAQPAVETFLRTTGKALLPQKGQRNVGVVATGAPPILVFEACAPPGTTTSPRQPEHCAVSPVSASEISNIL